MNLTIAIITRQRPVKLERCLSSIIKQSSKNFEVLVVDNDDLGSAKAVVRKFNKKLNIKYFIQKIQSVPKSRNLALKKSKTNLIAFVDDDCVLDKDWVKEAKKSVQKNRADFIIGNTKLYNPQSILALAQFQRETFWFKKSLNKKNKANKNTVDTKNIVLNLEKIKKHKLFFDEGAVVGPYDSADYAFGIEMEKLGFNGFFEERMILWHEEGRALRRFVKRAFYRGRNAAFLTKKHNLDNIFKDSDKKNIYTRTRDFFKDFKKEMSMYTSDLDSNNLKKIIITFFAKIYEYSFEAGFQSYRRH